MAYKWNGTTVTFPGAVAKVVGTNDASRAKKIPVTASGDTEHTNEMGLPEKSATIDIIGRGTIAVGDKATLTITYPDATSFTEANMIVESVEGGGQLDEKVTRKISLVKGTA